MKKLLLLIFILLISSSIIISASNVENNEISAFFNNTVTITYDGEKQDFKDEMGNVRYPISYEGTTYLPIRAICDLLKINIEWDGDNNSITISPNNVLSTDNMLYLQLAEQYATEQILRMETKQRDFIKNYLPDKSVSEATTVLASRVDKLEYATIYRDYILFHYTCSYLPDDIKKIVGAGAMEITEDGWYRENYPRYLVFTNTNTPEVVGEFRCEFTPTGNSEQFYNDLEIWIDSIKQFTEEAAITLVKKELIEAYENIYGEFSPSDTKPTLYSDDKEDLRYIIPRLTVSKETNQYYIIPVIWEFYVDKVTRQVYKFYNGKEDHLYTFNPKEKTALGFAG